MPMRLSFFERQVFWHHQWGPGPLLDIFGVLAFKVLHTACKLDIFEQLQRDGPANAADLAERMDAERNGLELLLEGLLAMGYVCRHRDGRFYNSRMSRRWMLQQGKGQAGRMLGLFDDNAQRWDTLDAVLRKHVRPSQLIVQQWLDDHPGSQQRYHEGLLGAATLLKDSIVRGIALPREARTVIDIGGSHGLYAIELCRRYPHICVDIFDKEDAREVANRSIAQHDMRKRVRFISGDILSATLCGRYDAALLINTVRFFDHEQVGSLLATVRNALNPQGLLYIAEQFAVRRGTPFARFNAAMILLELYNSGGFPITEVQLREMLATNGFERIRFIRLRRSPGIHMLCGRKK